MTQPTRKLPTMIPHRLARAGNRQADAQVQGSSTPWSFTKIASFVLALYIVATFVIAFRMNCIDRSLWLDESMLAWSFLQRSIFTLTNGPFEYLQSAPVLYLYIVKLFTLAFGNSEFVLRLPSFIFYVAVVFLAYRILKDGYQVNEPVPLAGAACVSSAIVFMRYASEFKQYMFEAFVVMLLWYLYVRYIHGKSWIPLAIAIPLAVWGANPASFFGGCICLYELIRALIEHDKARARRAFLVGCLLVVSFVAYYYYWLKPSVGSMRDYWIGYEFPLNWFDPSEFERGAKLVEDMFFWTFSIAGAWAIVPLAIAGLACCSMSKRFIRNASDENDARYSCIARQHITRVVAMLLLFALVVSSFGLFPLTTRLWLFSYPIVIVAAFAMVGICLGNASSVSMRTFTAVVLFVAIAASSGVPKYFHKQEVYLPYQELNPNIAYLQQNVKSDESVYVWNWSIPAFQYKNGYGNTSIGAGRNNVIFGTTKWENGSNRARLDGIVFGPPSQVQGVAGEEIDNIVSLEKCWVLLSHQAQMETLYAAMTTTGYTELVLDAYKTPLYFHFQKPADSKQKCTYELVSATTKGNVCNVKIRVTNTGQTQIGNGLSALYLSDESATGFPVPVGTIAPGEPREVLMSFEWNDRDTVSLGLDQKDQYRLSELGIEPITITRSETE